MSYKGETFRFPLGTQGLMLDGAQTRMPIDALTETNNITLFRGIIESAPGSVRWNKTALPSSIQALTDFWPDDVSQRLFTICSDGLLRRHLDYASTSVVGPKTASDAQTLTLATNSPPMFVTGGAINGDSRKLFLFTGTTQVQVVDGDTLTRRDMSKPALDWTKNFPTAGCIHRGRLVAWGNKNLPHEIYISSATDHEDFQTLGAALFFPVFPGESEGIISCYDFKGRLFILKYPYGVYYLDDSDPSVANWRIQKLTASFGVASAFSCVEGLNDLFVANSQGSITQMSATLDFGSMTTGNVLRNLKNESYIRQATARIGYMQRHAIWYEDKKTAIFTYRSAGNTQNDLMLYLDFNDPQTPIRAHWGNKDQANCLALVKDSTYVMRPFYGSSDGYIYRMDSGTYDVGGSAYTSSFKTLNHDFGQTTPPGQQNIAEQEKLYDFLEITFEEAGNWNLTVDVYIDNYFSETLTVNMTKEQYLGNFLLGPTGVNQALGKAPQSYRIPLHGKGRRISFRCHVSALHQYFRISDMLVYFRPAGQGQED